MSARPSWWRSSLTLPAADSVRLITSRLLALLVNASIIPAGPTTPASFGSCCGLLEVLRRSAGDRDQAVRLDREHGIGGSGRGPHDVVAEEVAVEQDPQRTRMP